MENKMPVGPLDRGCPEDAKRELQHTVLNLLHASECLNNNCEVPKCGCLKRGIDHMKTCDLKSECILCKKFMALICFHSGFCQNTSCRVPFCCSIKMKVKETQLAFIMSQSQDAEGAASGGAAGPSKK